MPVVIHFKFRDARPREEAWWLVVEDGVADLCRDDPGRELMLVVDATVRSLTDVWTGERTAQEVLQSRELRVAASATRKGCGAGWARIRLLLHVARRDGTPPWADVYLGGK